MTRTLTPTEVSRQAETILRDFAEAEPKVPSPLSPVALRPWLGRHRFASDSVGLDDLTPDARRMLCLAVDPARWPLVVVAHDPNDAAMLAAALFSAWPTEPNLIDLIDLANTSTLPAAADSDALLIVTGIPAKDEPDEAEAEEMDRRQRAEKSARRDKAIAAGRAEGLSFDGLMKRCEEAEAEFQSNRPTPRDGGQQERTHRARMLGNLLTRRQQRGQATVVVSSGSVTCDFSFTKNWGVERVASFGSSITAIDADNVRVEVRRPKHLDV